MAESGELQLTFWEKLIGIGLTIGGGVIAFFKLFARQTDHNELKGRVVALETWKGSADTKLAVMSSQMDHANRQLHDVKDGVDRIEGILMGRSVKPSDSQVKRLLKEAVKGDGRNG